jgi:hypothetical protein
MLFKDMQKAGKEIKIFEAFLDARERAEETLSEAGYDFDSLMEAIQNGEDLDENLLESGSSTDFPNYLADKITKRLMWGYTDVDSTWRTYTRTYSVPDFKPISFTRLSEHQDLMEVPEGGRYEDSAIHEIVGPSITVRTLGRLFSLTRRVLINDDLNQLRDRPAGMGRAAARTLNKDVVGKLEANVLTYDGNALISAAHNNILSGAPAALSEDSAAQAMLLMRLQTTDDGNRIGLRMRTLLVPPQLETIADRILTSTAVPQPSEGLTPVAGAVSSLWTTRQHGLGGTNVLAGRFVVVSEDYLLDPNDWYGFADPQEAPAMGTGFLNGDETPDVFLKDPGMRNVLGGTDPYSMEFDEIVWKIRHEWGTAALDWRGVVRAMTP